MVMAVMQRNSPGLPSTREHRVPQVAKDITEKEAEGFHRDKENFKYRSHTKTRTRQSGFLAVVLKTRK